MCPGTMGKLKEQSMGANKPDVVVPRVLNECQHSQATHPRGIKKLVECRAMDRDGFFKIWIQCMEPLFLVSKREPVVERMLKFAASFTAYWDEAHEDDCEHFVEEYLGLLLKWADASHKSVRFRACQMISEVILKLPEDIPVVDELWDNIISSMQRRMQDKLTSVRVYAARALSRLVITDDIENDRTVTAYRQALDFDQSAEVRKMVVMSMPAMNVTVADMVERTADISEVVRKAAYHILGTKFRIQSLSIMQRALILQRGLAERVPGVRAECVEMLKSNWLERDCEGKMISLLRYLDVETHEKVGENVMLELLKQDLDVAAICSGGLRQFLPSDSAAGDELRTYKILDAESALYWRMLCSHLHTEAEAKGCDAATTGGAEAVVKAAAAADSNDYLESILPPTVADYVRLVEAHVHGGPATRFAARQLLLISKLMNFIDNTSRREAALLLQFLLERSAVSERSLDEVVGDGLSLGGEELWASAVAELAHHVHASPGEFAQVVSASLAQHARPCREGGANIMQWLHCLAMTALLLENIDSLHQLDGQAIEPQEIQDSLLLPAVKHLHPEVQRAGVRCLGIFCGLEKVPSSRGVEQLRLCLSLSDRYYVQEMALRALFDLILQHGATGLDHALGILPDISGVPHPPGPQTSHKFRSADDNSEREQSMILRLPLLELLAGSFDHDDLTREEDEIPLKTCIAAEGFAKVLLQSKRFPEIGVIQDGVLAKLVCLYFSFSTQNFARLRQCLNVFFRSYCSQSVNNKRAISKVFVPVMRKEWPGIYGNREKSGTVLAARKHAADIGRFMLLLLQLPILVKEAQHVGNTTTVAPRDENVIQDGDEAINEGHEELAIRICSEVISLNAKKSMAGKTYIATLCRFIPLLRYRASQHEEIKCLYQILPSVFENLPPGEKTLLKELKETRERLKALDKSPDNVLTDEQMYQIIEKIGGQNAGDGTKVPAVESTPLKARTGRRRASNNSRNSSRTLTPVPPSTRTLRTRPETLSRLAKTQALKNQSAAKVSRKDLDSLYESASSDLYSDTTTASSSGSEFEVRKDSRSKAKASSKDSGGLAASNRMPRASIDSDSATSACYNGYQSKPAGFTSVDRIVSEGEEGEDEASPLQAEKRIRQPGGVSRMRKLEMERDSPPILSHTGIEGASREQLPGGSGAVSERPRDIRSDEAAHACTKHESVPTRRGKSSKPRNSVECAEMGACNAAVATSSLPMAKTIPGKWNSSAQRNMRQTPRNGPLAPNITNKSSVLSSSFETDDGSSEFEAVTPKRLSQVL
ncbi:condensin complex subunit 3 [Marchantia polymorpha subsp. ruderalis]|uniref:Nuclear condensin complex subunit 3 C-terminal domain-containing protein n=2 Tax=Marchantia polymorpha TaxID=3197 RepID=A0AAF6BI94_MARPO|nr:hypothetical protein MARPO_0032s0119 [Marchantia polymorpha]BBN11728.1 hypothetical protein Mp_5g14270 [Marchantia polymorpha subsp. ruderalis]|eukprot:PTQ41946.1 hypothetical protein MARPO_0032s0119 [Marchantia polymorpha]